MVKPDFALADLRRRVLELFRKSHARTGLGAGLHVGSETRTDPASYRWDGMRRGGDPEHPSVIFQYTLDGAGAYESAGRIDRVEPGSAFLAVVPSAHRYYLPEFSLRPAPGLTAAKSPPSWTFFWIILHHPYGVSRMIARQRAAGAVWKIDPESLLMVRALALLEGVCNETFRDPFAQEEAILSFVLEYDRFGDALAHPQNARDEFLEEVRRYVLARLRQPIHVAELAAHRHMSRSHFTHAFTAQTGISPASYIMQVRLDEVRRRLVNNSSTLYAIASETGFADANHLCKVFRRKYHLSPGAFRRQMGPSRPSLHA